MRLANQLGAALGLFGDQGHGRLDVGALGGCLHHGVEGSNAAIEIGHDSLLQD
jgi:hypothetical protein